MKVNERRVAWIAALALAAMLAATPREGAAGPYKMIDQPHPPMLGDPDVPGDSSIWTTIVIRVGGLQVWIRPAPTPIVVIVPSPKREAPQRDRRSIR